MMETCGFTLRFTMKSDWSIGSGTGRYGALDGLIQRDDDHLPYLPVATIRGIWRDAAEQLAFALDQGIPGGRWAAAVDHLFGSQPAHDRRGNKGGPPLASRIRPGPGRLSKAIRAALAGKHRRPLREALTFAKPGVMIDPDTGGARQEFLRFEEAARAGAVLNSEVTLADNNDALVALAACSARMIESLGGNRRRGSGRCSVDVTGFENCGSIEDLKSAVKCLENTKMPDLSRKRDRDAGRRQVPEPGIGRFRQARCRDRTPVTGRRRGRRARKHGHRQGLRSGNHADRLYGRAAGGKRRSAAGHRPRIRVRRPAHTARLSRDGRRAA